MPSARVLLADPHHAFRKGLCSLLDDASDVSVVGEADGGVQALRMAGELRPDVLLTEVHFPDLTGPDVARRLRGQNPETKVLVLSAYTDVACRPGGPSMRGRRAT